MQEEIKEMIKVDSMGDVCPVPIVKTKNAIREMDGAGELEIFVDNETSVQNLTKMARQKGYGVDSSKLGAARYRVHMTLTEDQVADMKTAPAAEEVCDVTRKTGGTVVAISAGTMGSGSEELGKILMKSFLFALSQQEELPEYILCYNGGAYLTCEGSESLEDLKNLEAAGVKIITCGTCADFYKIKDRVQVGTIGNMYEIVEKMMQASDVIRP
jgi:selenium metabolism protein YedF